MYLPRLIFFITVWVVWTHVFAQENGFGVSNPSELKTRFDAMKLEIEAAGAAEISDLSSKYGAALDKLMMQKSEAGDLDAIVAIRAEKGALKTPRDLPKLTDSSPELERMRSTFVANRDRIDESVVMKVKDLSERYAKGLIQLEVQLTKVAKVDEALAVRAERQRIEAEIGKNGSEGSPPPPSIGKAMSSPALVEVAGEFRELKEGEVIYANRGYTWTDVPRKFSGWEIQHRPGANVTKLEFEIRTPGFAYIMVDQINVEKLTSAGWKRVDECGSLTPGKDRFPILEKSFEPGKQSLEALGFLGVRVMRPKSNPGETGTDGRQIKVLKAVYGPDASSRNDVTKFMENLVKIDGWVRVPHATWQKPDSGPDDKLFIEFRDPAGEKKTLAFPKGHLFKVKDDLK